MNNSDRAWVKLGALRERASLLGGIAITALVLGALVFFISMGFYLGSNSASATSGATAGLGIGVLLFSLASTFAMGWFFARSMSDHAEVVYFSSPSNDEWPIEDELVPAQQIMYDDVAQRCQNCGGVAKDDEEQCTFCGERLNK